MGVRPPARPSAGGTARAVAPDRQPLGLIPGDDDGPAARRLARTAWAFAVLGVLLRLTRYLVNYPLWHDEAFVAANFLERSYAGLMRPLDYGQVCPLLFLWIELTAVKLLGFSERSLRLFPMLCSVASVVLFRHVAGRVLRGWALALAVGVFAVAFYPIRHGGEVKPYASDLLVALALLAPAVESWRQPGRVLWLWVLAVVAPVAVALSYPAIFVAAGIGLTLLVPAWRRGRRVRLAFATYGLATVGAFLAQYALCAGPQSDRVGSAYRRGYWADSFPPLDRPAALAAWLVSMHTGNMLAYPIGGERGASAATAACVGVAAAVLRRRGRAAIAGLCLAPMGMGLAAAAIGRYPYGGEARIMQYLAPGLCLMAGTGAAASLARIRRPAARLVALRVGVGALAALGTGLLARDLVRPYRTIEDVRSRRFARWFWAEQARGAELACVRTDLGLVFDPRHWDIGMTATYLCERRIASERHRRGGPPDLRRVSATRPLRCVLFNEHPVSHPAFESWMAAMRSRYEVSGLASYTPRPARPSERWLRERYVVYEFVPRSAPQVAEGHRSESVRR